MCLRGIMKKHKLKFRKSSMSMELVLFITKLYKVSKQTALSFSLDTNLAAMFKFGRLELNLNRLRLTLTLIFLKVTLESMSSYNLLLTLTYLLEETVSQLKALHKRQTFLLRQASMQFVRVRSLPRTL